MFASAQPQKSPFFPEVMLSFWRNTSYSFMWSRSKQALEVSVMCVCLHGCVCMLTSRECKVGLVFYGHQVVFVELRCSFYCPLRRSRAQRVLTECPRGRLSLRGGVLQRLTAPLFISTSSPSLEDRTRSGRRPSGGETYIPSRLPSLWLRSRRCCPSV